MAEAILAQKSEVQTVDKVETTLDTYTVPDDHSSGMFFAIVAVRDTSNDGVFGGYIEGTFNRTTTGNVVVTSSSTTNVTGTSAGTILVDASGNDLRLRVESPVNQNWDWTGYWEIYNE